MAEIHIQRRHAMPLKKARDAANDFARRLNEKFELESEWEGDALHFERSGVSGRLMLTRNDVTIDLKPGFLLSAFAGKMEGYIKNNLDQLFGKSGATMAETARAKPPAAKKKKA